MANRSNINFNSIKVRLEQATLYAREEVSHFNSIKVRLEQTSKNHAKADCPSFQFHKGAIRTRDLLKCC